MDFRDIIKKMNDTSSENKTITESVEPIVEKKLPSLKNIFEALQAQTPIPVVGKDGDKASAQAGFIHIDDTSPAGKAMGDALGKLAQQKKAQIVIPNTQQKSTTGTTQTGLSTGGGAPSTMKEEQVDEKWAGDAKVKPTGQYKDKTKEELKSMLAKLKKSGPHGKDSPAAKKMRQINFALRAKGGWKSGEGAAMKEEQIEEKAKNPYAIGMAAAKKAAGITKKHATDLPKSVVVKGHEIAKKIKKKEKMDEGDIASTKSQDTMGAGLGAGRSSKVLEGGKPDFLDLDKDGNKKESMKKAAADKKKKVKESMNPKIKAAYHEGYSHGLRGATHSGKRYEDMEEARQYHEGYKCGLDECYGMASDPKMGDRESPIVGLVGENMPASVPAMATQAMEADMEEGNLFTGNLAKARAAGKTMADLDGDGDMEKVQKESIFTFEDLDTQLNALLKEDVEPVVEGLSVSMSTGNEGSPDSVSVTGTDDAAAKLLAFIKQVGLGGMGSEKPMVGGEPAVMTTVSDYGAPKHSGHDEMAALMKKVGVDDEEGHDHKHEGTCNECGMMEAECGCEKESVEEVQTQDQTLYATTESDDSEDDGFDASARNTELDNAGKPASGGATNEDGAEAPGSNPVGQSEQEEAEEVNEESTEKMDQHAEKAAEKVKKDIEYDDKKDREHDKLDEWANNAGQKGTDTAFEQDIEFMTKVISGGLNKPKVTGQTTIPVISSQDARDGTKEDLASWMKLAGVKK